MKYEDAIEAALNGNSVLFVGAGFSNGAQNIRNENIPNGRELAVFLAHKCGLDSNTSLEDAADEYKAIFGTDKLIKELVDLFTVKNVAQYHKIIADISWNRIYTTNYDDVLEFSCIQASKRIKSVSLADNIQITPKNINLCIHFNGYIKKLDQSTIDSDFKLTETSYITATIAESDWADLFRRDISSAQAVFFVGYSLYDLDIRRLLFENKELSDKCFFILGEKPDKSVLRRVSKFGHSLEISASQFADNISALKRNFIPLKIEKINTLSIKEYKKAEIIDKKISDRLFIDLMLFGNISKELIESSILHKSRYFLFRTKIELALDLFKKGANYIIATSDMGNGKSLFIEGLKISALNEGYRIFEATEHNRHTTNDLEIIAKVEDKTIIIFEEYQNWLDEIRQYSLLKGKNTKVILSARNNLHDVLIDILEKRIKGYEFIEISLDILNDKEIEWFVNAFDEYGLWGELATLSSDQKKEFLRKKCDSQISAILLHLFKSPNIERRLREILSEIKKSKETYNILLGIFILNVMNQSLSIDMIVDIWGPDCLRNETIKKSGILGQIIDIDRNKVLVKSSVTGAYTLKYLSDSAMIVDNLIMITKRAHTLKGINKDYFDLFTNIIRFSQLQLLLPEEGRTYAVISFYESIKNLESCKENPHFWLQYAIAILTLGDLPRAKIYFDNAYAFVSKNNRQETINQIDNHYARYLLMEAETNDDARKAMESFRQAYLILSKQMGKERRHYPYRISLLIKTFLDKHVKNLELKELDTIRRSALEILERITELPYARRNNRYVRECKITMEVVVEKCDELMLKKV